MSQVTSRIGQVAAKVATPFAWAGQKAYTRATIATRFYPTELQQQITEARANGDDLAVNCTKTFVEAQWKLVPYRIQKLKDEIDALKNGNASLSSMTFKEWVRSARFVVRLLFLFMFGVMAGRLSIWPLITPDSIFAEERLRRPTGTYIV